jgi:hypothetical protein
MVRLAAAAMLAGSAAGAVVTAPPAAATLQHCPGATQWQVDSGVDSTPPTEYVYVDDIGYCVPPPGQILIVVGITKDIGGNWVQVARGNGSAYYACTGGPALYETSVSVAENLPPFSCG